MVGGLEGHAPKAVKAEDPLDAQIDAMQAEQVLCNTLEHMVYMDGAINPEQYTERVAAIMKRETTTEAKKGFLGRVVGQLDQYIARQEQPPVTGAKEKKLLLVPAFTSDQLEDVRSLADRFRAMLPTAAADVETGATIQ